MSDLRTLADAEVEFVSGANTGDPIPINCGPVTFVFFEGKSDFYVCNSEKCVEVRPK